jgi:cyclase
MDQWKLIAGTDARRTRFDEIPRYAEGLYELKSGIYAWMTPNGSWGESNAGLVVGDGASLLVDTLWDLKYTRVMLDAMRPLTDAAPINTVVTTHADGDHWWGNELVADAEIIATRACIDELSSVQPKSMLLLEKTGKLLSWIPIFSADKVGHWFKNMAAPYDFHDLALTPPTRGFAGRMQMDVGGRPVELIEVGPAHTRGDLIVYVPDAGTLFTGDILFMESTPVIWAGPVTNWIAALDLILEMDVDVIVPGHGPVTDKDGVRQVKAYWEFTDTETRRQYDDGLPAAEAAKDIVLGQAFAGGPYATWNSPERMMTNVHTLYRHLQGRTDHPKKPELTNILRKQALLAHQLPDAQPAVMRKQQERPS